jgi:hypothetical protein
MIRSGHDHIKKKLLILKNSMHTKTAKNSRAAHRIYRIISKAVTQRDPI